MGRFIKNVTLSVIVALISICSFSGPVFAISSSEVPTTPLTILATSNNPSDDIKDDNADTDEEDASDDSTCYDQVGGIGWLVCPGTSLLAKVIDGAFSILESLIQIEPVSLDEDAPIHVVWYVMRNFANAIFIIFFLVVIYSQITGFGISNYHIKRVLPRIIISAILVNLSFIICILAIDISNIIGASLRGLFLSIENQAIANSNISESAVGISVADVVATILGVGVVGGGLTIAVAGGFTGLIWLLIPIILSGALSVISAVVTMAARQALVLLLTMVSPLAFVAYLLPNTEKWFKKWYQLFIAMVVFYPMFSILYGASHLAGLVMISSATNWLGVILGIAVQVLPLFMSFPLLRMSGTVLGRIDGLIYRAGAPATKAVKNTAAERRINAKSKQLASTSNRPSVRLAKYLEQRRLNRKLDTEQAIEVGHKERLANYNRSMYRRSGQLSRRGLTRYQSIQRNLDSDNAVVATAIDFDEGFAHDGTDTRVRTRDLHRVEAVNNSIIRSVDIAAINKARKSAVELENTRSRAERIRQGAKDEHSQIHQQITSAFNLRNSSTDPDEQLAIQKSINATLSDAITDSRRVDKAARESYIELYDDMESGNGPKEKLIEAIDQKDYNSMTAAISVMAKRGDFQDIEKTLAANSSKLADDVRMQKQLADELITKKADDQILWAYAKANFMRRAMYTNAVSEGREADLAPFIDFKTFINGVKTVGDGDTAKANEKFIATSLDKILEDINGSDTTATQDRTVFKSMLEFMQSGDLSTDSLHIPMKYIRSAAVSGRMDGEQLGMLNRYITFGFDTKSDTQSQFFESNKDKVRQNIESFLKDMSAKQLTSIKSSTFDTLNKTMLAIDPDSATISTTGDPQRPVSQHILDLLQNQISSVNRPNYAERSSMNNAVREMLGISTDT